MLELNNDWGRILKDEMGKEYFQNLKIFLQDEYRSGKVYPSAGDIFHAFCQTPFDEVKVVIVGQDPYIREGEAHGLAFSVGRGVKVPPSLKNIFKELASDIGCVVPGHGNLEFWAGQGVFLLNNILTVREGVSRSHAGRGWEVFTDAVLVKLNERSAPIVFMLWGNDAKTKGRIITSPQHLVLTAAHPSPLAGGKFFGCKHFSKANEFLAANSMVGIDWQLPEL